MSPRLHAWVHDYAFAGFLGTALLGWLAAGYPIEVSRVVALAVAATVVVLNFGVQRAILTWLPARCSECPGRLTVTVRKADRRDGRYRLRKWLLYECPDSNEVVARIRTY